MKKIVMAALVFASVAAVNAQENTNSGFQIKSASIQFGLSSGSTAPISLTDFQKLAPNSDFKESDLFGFERQNYSYESAGTSFSLNLIIAKPQNEKLAKLNAEFRLGLSFQQADVFTLNYNRTEEFRVDTLISQRNGEQLFVDSIYSQNYDLAYNQRHVMIDADVTVSTNPNKRWKFYGGIGFSLGVSVAPQTTISYNASSSLDRNVNFDEIYQPGFDSEFDYESFGNDAGFFGRVYVPLGLDFRIGKRKETLKKYHLFLESRPSLTFQSVPELNAVTTTSSVTGFGFRYDF